MKPQHLSDEAVAAFADGFLTGHARDRACRHLNACPECRQAVKEQREAAAALRTAPAPALPTNLLDRLRTVPLTAPVPAPPAALGPDGSAVLPTTAAPASRGFGASFAPMAAFAPAAGSRRPRGRTYLTAAMLAGVTGALVAGGVAASGDDHPAPSIKPVNHLYSGAPHGSGPVNVFHGGNRP